MKINNLNGLAPEIAPYRLNMTGLDFAYSNYTSDELVAFIQSIPEVTAVEVKPHHFEIDYLVYYQGMTLRELDYRIREWRHRRTMALHILQGR